MKKIICSSFLLWSIAFQLFAQQYDNSLGIFRSNCDVGNVQLPGATFYDLEKQIYTLEGSGTNIWFDQDEFQYAWKKIKGDFILTAQVEFSVRIDKRRAKICPKKNWISRLQM